MEKEKHLTHYSLQEIADKLSNDLEEYIVWAIDECGSIEMECSSYSSKEDWEWRAYVHIMRIDDHLCIFEDIRYPTVKIYIKTGYETLVEELRKIFEHNDEEARECQKEHERELEPDPDMIGDERRLGHMPED